MTLHPRWTGLGPMSLVGLIRVVFISSLALIAGCQARTLDAPPNDPGVSFAATAPIPPVAPLYAAATIILPATVIAHAPVAPPPPPAAQVSQLVAVAAMSPPPRSGPAQCGLLVCEPISTGADASLAAFGSGCGRWLHLTAAGQPALGRTPLWGSLARGETEMTRTDLRLTPPQTAALTGVLGVTHVATGRISGTAAHCTLTYQLWRVPQLVPLGVPFTLIGSKAQLVAGLPGLSRALDARLGIAHADVPTAVGLTPSELSLLGALPLFPALTDAQLGTLAALAVRSPLAGMALLNTGAISDQSVLDHTVAALMRQQPGNALVISQIADRAATALRPYASPVTALIQRDPQSYLLARTDGITQGVWGTRAGEWAAAQRCVADAPGNPAAWQARAMILADVGQDLRQCRTADKITDAEWASLNRTYSQWEASALQATRLDPQYGTGWYELAEAATFAGDNGRARSALWTALKLDPMNISALDWGLEMFQSKWLGDQGALDKVAQAAASGQYGGARAAEGVAEELRSAGYPALADGVLSKFLTQTRAAVARLPGSGEERWQLAAILDDLGDAPALGASLREYKAAASLLPNSPELHDDYGSVLDKRGRMTEAVAQYRRAVALDPFFAKGYYDLGWDLKQSGQLAPAKQAMYTSIHLDPTDGDVYNALGRILTAQGQYPAAVSTLGMAARLTPGNWEVFDMMCRALNGEGQYPASLTAGRQALTLNPTDSAAYDDMADDDLHTHDWADSLTESSAALKINPQDAIAHENLGEAYIGQGRRPEARAEWQKVLTMGDARTVQVAQGMLERYP